VTLCIVWNDAGNIHFASDSRGTAGGNTIDAVIKVLRIPYRISGAAFPGETPPVLAEGEIGMAAAGATLIAMMTKEALVELVRNMQGVQGHNTFGMDEIASFLFQGFKEICGRFHTMGTAGDTSVIIAGHCAATRRLRSFKMEHVWALQEQFCTEVLTNHGDVEYLGVGIPIAAGHLLGQPLTQRTMLSAMQAVIDDPSVPGVGGNIQYGSFNGSNFVVSGVAVMTQGEVHYWRGPLDLNGAAFNQAGSLLPSFPYLDMI
jgi:hypothetical protein